jgi:hypothetical protein
LQRNSRGEGGKERGGESEIRSEREWMGIERRDGRGEEREESRGDCIQRDDEGRGLEAGVPVIMSGGVVTAYSQSCEKLKPKALSSWTLTARDVRLGQLLHLSSRQHEEVSVTKSERTRMRSKYMPTVEPTYIKSN